MIMTSSLISRLTKLTNEDLREYLRQIGLTAYEMNSIVNSLLRLAEVSKADVLFGSVQMAESLKMFKSALATSSGNKTPKSFFPRHGRIPHLAVETARHRRPDARAVDT